ncbi:MAG TPA: diaminopimelate decarboxylase [Gemmatimonadaceae bacterium]|nr:diaminopimelate decarboxylase [Gemmatimonadaceae bacterium]
MGQGILKSGFPRVGGELHCEEVPLSTIADAAGTPVYVYSAETIRDRYRRLDEALAGIPHRLHYTLKANSSSALLRVAREMGAGADVVSGGELHRALAAGFTPEEVIFGGVGKTERELREGIEAGVLLINVESEAELRAIDRIAGEMQRVAPVGIRVNPELSLEAAHDYIKTGQKGSKFGIPFEDVIPVAKLALSMRNLKLIGLDMHLGSQLSRIEPYRLGTERLLLLTEELRQLGARDLQYLDIGGGLGVRYDSEQPPDLDAFARIIGPLLKDSGLTLIMEPGRFIIGNAGALLSRVLYRKASGGKAYVVADAGMTELLRPSHYGAFHRIEAVVEGPERITADVVGPICESGDFLALDRQIVDVEAGDLIAVFDTGAYGYVMASNYNSRPRAAEVLVDGDRFAIVTARESYSDLTRLEVATPEWRR